MVIAERLSGQTPFTATDHFSESAAPDGVAAGVAPVSPSRPVETAAEPVARPAGREDCFRPASRVHPRVGAPMRRSTCPARSGGLDDAEESSAPASPKSLDNVFKSLRKESGRGDAADQSAQHMKLARTYLEMGMVEEATTSLKTAARSPRQRFEAASMLGRLYKEHGDLEHAIEWFERAAEAAAPGAEDSRALLYDLGVALEDAGETTRALSVFLELQSDGGEYRDVAQRADRLARVQAGG